MEPPARDCVYSPRRLCPLCLPLRRKRESLHSSFERKRGKDGRGYLAAYNRRLTMSLPAAAERQFRVNLQNDGIRYPSYKLCCCCCCCLRRRCFFLRYIGGIDLQAVRDGNSVMAWWFKDAIRQSGGFRGSWTCSTKYPCVFSQRH